MSAASAGGPDEVVLRIHVDASSTSTTSSSSSSSTTASSSQDSNRQAATVADSTHPRLLGLTTLGSPSRASASSAILPMQAHPAAGSNGVGVDSVERVEVIVAGGNCTTVTTTGDHQPPAARPTAAAAAGTASSASSPPPTLANGATSEVALTSSIVVATQGNPKEDPTGGPRRPAWRSVPRDLLRLTGSFLTGVELSQLAGVEREAHAAVAHEPRLWLPLTQQHLRAYPDPDIKPTEQTLAGGKATLRGHTLAKHPREIFIERHTYMRRQIAEYDAWERNLNQRLAAMHTMEVRTWLARFLFDRFQWPVFVLFISLLIALLIYQLSTGDGRVTLLSLWPVLVLVAYFGASYAVFASAYRDWLAGWKSRDNASRASAGALGLVDQGWRLVAPWYIGESDWSLWFYLRSLRRRDVASRFTRGHQMVMHLFVIGILLFLILLVLHVDGRALDCNWFGVFAPAYVSLAAALVGDVAFGWFRQFPDRPLIRWTAGYIPALAFLILAPLRFNAPFGSILVRHLCAPLWFVMGVPLLLTASHQHANFAGWTRRACSAFFVSSLAWLLAITSPASFLLLLALRIDDGQTSIQWPLVFLPIYWPLPFWLLYSASSACWGSHAVWPDPPTTMAAREIHTRRNQLMPWLRRHVTNDPRLQHLQY